MELGKSPRRLSVTLSISTDASSDEAYELLEERLDGEGRELGFRRRRVHTDRSKWLPCVSLFYTLLFLAAVVTNAAGKLFPTWYVGRPNGSHSDESIQHATREKMLGIRLYPEHHVDRPPKTITHFWNVTSGFRSPDGVKKEIYLVNGAFPGPTVECRSGDRLVINVTNSLGSGEGVSIHWHGLEMRGSNHMDGAIGFTQCPILPGNSFLYDFEVSEEHSGTFWWHAHSQVQRGDGMYGGLVVHKPRAQGDDMKAYAYQAEVLVMIGDWYHRSAVEVLDWYTSTRGFGNEPVPDSMLVNGVGKFICSKAVPARPVECIDTSEQLAMGLLGLRSLTSTRLRIVNTGSLAGFTVLVTSAKLTPLTVDSGFPISGSAADSAGIIYPGERVDVVLEWDQISESSSELLVSLDPEDFQYTNPALQLNQTFQMFSHNITSISTVQVATPTTHFDLTTATAIARPQLPSKADHTILLYAKTQKLSISSNHPAGYINRTTWTPQASPPYPLLALPRSEWDSNQLVPYIPISQSSKTWIDIIINNLDDGSHPFHLHGYSFYVLASYRSEHGWGSYNPFADTGHKPELNLQNPVKKDTVSVPRRGYVVLRLKADNEGIWMLHCHVLFHQASGMAMGIHVGSDEMHGDFDDRSRKLFFHPQ